MGIITISRLTGSGGREIATATANAFVYRLTDGNDLDSVTCPEDLVVLGGGAQFLFPREIAALHVQLIAPLPYRIARVMRLANVERDEAANIIAQRDQTKREYIQQRYSADWRDPSYYDLVLNVERFDNEAAVEIIIDAARRKGLEPRNCEVPVDLQPGSSPEFAHSSEREFARVMDFYRVCWEYEPRTFPLEWDQDRKVTSAFTPDFYLPDLDLYIEITTMKQSLVTKKNRKVRRLRELYPEINIKVLYERDYRNLIWKYGISEPDDS